MKIKKTLLLPPLLLLGCSSQKWDSEHDPLRYTPMMLEPKPYVYVENKDPNEFLADSVYKSQKNIEEPN